MPTFGNKKGNNGVDVDINEEEEGEVEGEKGGEEEEGWEEDEEKEVPVQRLSREQRRLPKLLMDQLGRLFSLLVQRHKLRDSLVYVNELIGG